MKKNLYIYILYMRKVVEKDQEKGLDCGERRSSVCSSLSSGLDFVEFTVKKKKKLL